MVVFGFGPFFRYVAPTVLRVSITDPARIAISLVELEAVAFTYAESQPLHTFLAKFVSDDGRICQALALRGRTRTITY